MTWRILILILSAVGLAFVSLIEAALVSIDHVRLRQSIQQGHRTAPLVEHLLERPEDLLGTLIILINLFVLLIANQTTIEANRRWGASAVPWANLAMLVSLLIFAEITPKTISVHYADRVALRTARITYVITRVLAPLVVLLNAISFGVMRVLLYLRILPGRIHATPTAFSEDDIKELLAAGEQSGEVEAVEREMIHGVIEFSEITARELMVPRTDLIALPSDASIEEAVQTFLDSGHSRIPVYEENADNMLGILYIKDVLIRLQEVTEQEGPYPALLDITRPVYFVPESKKSDELLREMQRKQIHLAVVVDEYGGTAGIITIEDLLEEIVGDIIDEYDRETEDIVTLPDGVTLVSGQTGLETIHDYFDIPLPEETEAETIGGYLTEQLGRIPVVDDAITLHGVQFTVMAVAHNRVERLRAIVIHPRSDQNHSC